MAGKHWLLVANPDVWDVWDWAESDEDFEGWTISQSYDEITNGDKVALWISGPEAGIYAIGRTTSGAETFVPPTVNEARRWKKKPDPARTRYVYADIDRYFFDHPIRKTERAADPDFANSLVLRMPRGRNPFPVTPTEWAALMRHTHQKNRTRPAIGPTKAVGPIVTERLLGAVRETLLPPVRLAAKVREQNESRLLKAYERHLGRQLTIQTIKLPSGERLVSDGYDATTNTLIEAKATADRASIRMAMGQLLDYSRFVAPLPHLIILVPQRPTDDLLALGAANGMKVAYKAGSEFVVH